MTQANKEELMTKRMKQFKHTRRKKEYYDRKVTHTKTTRLMCLGKLIPEEWAYVRISILDRTKNSVTCKISKLLGVNNHAYNVEVNTPSQQNT